ncbi:MAG: hypothetical protein WD182_06085 [Bacteroidota bacterium]
MDFWAIIWFVALGLGTLGFAFIGVNVIVKGFAEVRSLLDDLGGGKE